MSSRAIATMMNIGHRDWLLQRRRENMQLQRTLNARITAGLRQMRKLYLENSVVKADYTSL